MDELLYLQYEMAFVKIQKSLAAHFSQLLRQSGALYREIIRKLLPGKGNIKFTGPEPLRLGGEVGHQLCARGALAHVRELFAETKILLGKLAEKISDDPAVVLTGGRTHIQNALYVQEHCRDGRFGEYTHIQQRTGRAGIGGGERLPCVRLRENVAVAPNVLLHDQNAAQKHKTDGFRRIPGVQQKRILREAFGFRIETGEHGCELLLGNARKKRGGVNDWPKFFHRNPFFVENSTDLLKVLYYNPSVKHKEGMDMKRRIIEIDQDKCNGCGACAAACHEGAIAMVNGKAQLMRDDYCDGLGDCLPACPTEAISFVEREAAAYDEQAVLENKQKKMRQQGMRLPGGCPGTRMRTLRHEEPSGAEAVPAVVPSRLSQWPVQIKLVPVNAPFFEGAKLLIAADCTAYAYAAFHERFIRGHITLVGCPKLDSVDYSEKLTEIIRNNDIQSVTVVRMEVPCCGGLEHAAKTALQNSGKFIPWQVVTISTDGRILD